MTGRHLMVEGWIRNISRFVNFSKHRQKQKKKRNNPSFPSFLIPTGFTRLRIIPRFASKRLPSLGWHVESGRVKKREDRGGLTNGEIAWHLPQKGRNEEINDFVYPVVVSSQRALRKSMVDVIQCSL